MNPDNPFATVAQAVIDLVTLHGDLFVQPRHAPVPRLRRHPDRVVRDQGGAGGERGPRAVPDGEVRRPC